MKRIITITLAAAASLSAAVALAAPPTNIAGTAWTVSTNGRTAELLITTQGGAGAPGASICQGISGEMGPATIRGWYCPLNGRIHFLHNNADSGVTVRVFTGSLSDQVANQPTTMAGTVTVLASAFGDLREYGFSATE